MSSMWDMGHNHVSVTMDDCCVLELVRVDKQRSHGVMGHNKEV